jgi:hypothetical protein
MMKMGEELKSRGLEELEELDVNECEVEEGG